jgi:hypothetical protein
VVVCNLTCPNIGFTGPDKQQFDIEPFIDGIEKVVGMGVRKVERDIRPNALTPIREARQPDPEPDPEPEPERELEGVAPRGIYKKFVWDNFMDVRAWATDDNATRLEMRQFYYAMNKRFKAYCERKGYKWAYGSTFDDRIPLDLRAKYFSQTLVRNYEDEVLGERVIDRDSRGFFVEPHSNNKVELGTLDVEKYVPNIEEFGTLLFIEKTGFFNQLHTDYKLDKRYDVGLISAKGNANTAARDLIEKIQEANPDIRLLTLTDLDIYGLGIAANARKADTLSAVDEFGAERIGITYEDIEAYDLQSEPKNYKKTAIEQLKNLHEDGEVDQQTFEFLTEEDGQRVEINALPPKQLNKYLENKFDELGIEKVAPESPEDVETADVDDLDTVRERAIDSAISSFLNEQLPTTLELRNALEDRLSATATDNGDGAGDGSEDSERVESTRSELESVLADLPLGDDDDAAEAVFDHVTEQLADRPAKKWRDINREHNRKTRRTASDHIDDYEDKLVAEGLDFLRSNVEGNFTYRFNGGEESEDTDTSVSDGGDRSGGG